MRKFIRLLIMFVADLKKVSDAVNTAKDREELDRKLFEGRR